MAKRSSGENQIYGWCAVSSSMMPCASSPCINLAMHCTQSNNNMGLIRVCTSTIRTSINAKTDLVNVSIANQRPDRDKPWLLVNKSVQLCRPQLRMMPLCCITDDATGPGQRNETAPLSSPGQSAAARKLPKNSPSLSQPMTSSAPL